MPYLELIDAFSVQDLLTNVNLIKTNIYGININLLHIESRFSPTSCDPSILRNSELFDVNVQKSLVDVKKIVNGIDVTWSQDPDIPLVLKGIKEINEEIGNIIPRHNIILGYCRSSAFGV